MPFGSLVRRAHESERRRKRTLLLLVPLRQQLLVWRGQQKRPTFVSFWEQGSERLPAKAERAFLVPHPPDALSLSLSSIRFPSAATPPSISTPLLCFCRFFSDAFCRPSVVESASIPFSIRLLPALIICYLRLHSSYQAFGSVSVPSFYFGIPRRLPFV